MSDAYLIFRVFFCLFACMFRFFRFSRIFHSSGDVTITDELLQIMTYARYSWPLNSERSLTCHTYYDTGNPSKWLSPRTRDTYTWPVSEPLAVKLSLPVKKT